MSSTVTRQYWFYSLLCTMAAAYAFAFQWLPIPEWVLLADFSLSLPLLHALLLRPTLKQWLWRWLQLTALGILLGSFIIPDQEKHWWRLLETGRSYYSGVLAIAEIGLALFLAYSIRRLLAITGNIDQAMQDGIFKQFGRSATAHLMLFEARIWYYALFLRKNHVATYPGDLHFQYHQHHGNASNQLGFIYVIAMELPLMHMLLHFIWSPMTAWIATALSAWALLYLLADYRATLRRPISLDAEAIHIRCGVLSTDAVIPYSMVQEVIPMTGNIRRGKGVRRYAQLGQLNVALVLTPGSRLPDMLGQLQTVTRVCLSLDDANAFTKAIQERLPVKVG